MAQKFVSIYITHDEIKMCVIEKNRNSEVVSMAFSVPTPQGCVDDGYIRDANQVGYAINNELSARRIEKVSLYFTIFSKKIAAKEVELPYNKNNKLMADMISANINEYFPMGNLDRYISRHTVLEQFDQGGQKKCMVSVYVIPKDLISGYYELARVLRLPLESIDYQVNSLLSVVKRQNRRGNTLFIQVDNDATHITVMKEQSQIFRRSVAAGVNSLVQAMASSQNLTEKEADEILKSKMMLDRRMNKDEYREFMRDFCASIARVVDFFGSRHPEIVLEGGRVFGSGIGIANIDGVLGEALGLEMEIVEHLVGVNIRNMKAIPGVNQLLFVTLTNAELAHYLPNIGALMESLDLSIVEEGGGGAVVIKKTGIGYGMLFGLLAFSIIIAVGGSGYFLIQRNNLQQEKANLERSIASLQPAEAVYNNYLAAEAYRNTFMSYIDSTVDNNEALLQLIITLEEILPQGVSLTSIQSASGRITLSVQSSIGKRGFEQFIIELKQKDFITDVLASSLSDEYDEFGIATTGGPIAFNIDYRKARAYAEANDSPAWQEGADFIGYVAPEAETGEEVVTE